MNTPPLDKALCDVLVATFITGTHIEATRDALAVVRLLRHLKPTALEVAVPEALQLLRVGDRLAARRVLEEADALNPGNAFVKAVLALTLIGQGDALWQAYVDEVKALPPDERALAIIASIEKAVRNEVTELAGAGDSDAGTASLPFLQVGVPC